MSTKTAPSNTRTFDVVVERVIGTVTVDPFGEGPPPSVVAMTMIAEEDQPGTYSYPMPDGRTAKVTVEWIGEPRPPYDDDLPY